MSLFKRYLIFFAAFFAAANAYAIRRYDLPYPHPLEPAFDAAIRKNHLNNINERKPRMVLIGDSTLTKGVDAERLSAALGFPVYSIGLPGSASTLWYLIIKNNVLEAETPPRYLAIFFRDNMLTMPGYRVQGQYFQQIDEYAGADDELLAQRAFVGLMNPLEKFAEAYVPIYAARRNLRERVEAWTQYKPAQGLGFDSRRVDNAFAEVFDDKNINLQGLNAAISSAEENLYPRGALDFDKRVGRSFLPEILRLAREKRAQVILIRMKTLRHDGRFPALENYMEEFASYAAANGAIVLDYAADERLPEEYFMDVLHLNEKGKQVFTQILAKELEAVLK